MALLGKKSPEEVAAREEAKEEERQRKELESYLKTPPGQARTAYERGDQVFQYAYNVMSQQAIVTKMVGASTRARSADPVDILNAVCDEGWELVNGSFVFIEQGQESRDKFMASGQNVAIKGIVMGYYLFKRCTGNRRE
jgi:hypothetical protein